MSRRQRTRILTDTVAQLTKEDIHRYGITVVPAATIFCDGRSFVDGVDISPAEAYELLRQNPDQFSTAAISPDYFTRAFEGLGDGVEGILCITVSSKLSGVYGNAVIARKQMRARAGAPRIEVFDSMNAAGGEGLIALAAARAASRGRGLDEVIRVAEKARENAECLFFINSLGEAYRSGRIPRVASQFADALRIRPLCDIREGKVHPIGLTRSRSRGVERIVGMARQRAGDAPVYVMVMHTAALAEAEKLKVRAQEKLNCCEVVVSEFSPVMGYSVGPGFLGLATCPEVVEWSIKEESRQ
jgi:DegV family protein with EDD domain